MARPSVARGLELELAAMSLWQIFRTGNGPRSSNRAWRYDTLQRAMEQADMLLRWPLKVEIENVETGELHARGSAEISQRDTKWRMVRAPNDPTWLAMKKKPPADPRAPVRSAPHATTPEPNYWWKDKDQ